MFMIPIPPTISDTDAIAPQQNRHHLGRRFLSREYLGQIAHREVIVQTRQDPMPLAQQRRHLLPRPVNGLRAHGLHHQ